MWLIVAADNLIERKRIAKFSTRELAEAYLEKAKCKIPGFIFSPNSLLSDCVWAKVVFEDDIPIDPVLW